jgi:hypothetical protein
MGHPNSIAALISGGLATLTVYLLNKYAHATINDAQSAGIATGYATVILFIGRRGLKGAVSGVWNGVWNGSPKPTAAVLAAPPASPVQAEPTEGVTTP